jgi:branched-subunit amino acid aminotransferase/4-amino-4-deoxychorismate lyase
MERSNALLYGKGIFTTVAIRNQRPLLWGKHWRRLTDNADKVVLDVSAHSEHDVVSMLSRGLVNSRLSDGRARITFLDQC